MKKTIISIMCMALALGASAAGQSNRGSRSQSTVTSSGMAVDSPAKQGFYILSEYILLLEKAKTMEELNLIQKSYSESLRTFKSKFPNFKPDKEDLELRNQIDKAFRDAHRRVLRSKK